MTPQTGAGSGPRVGLRRRSGLAGRVVERNVALHRRSYLLLATRLTEPFLYLFAVGVGVGALVGSVEVDEHTFTYQEFVAPALLVTSAMNLAVFASSFEFFAKFKWMGSYESMLATPIGVDDLLRGELAWTLGIAAVQSAAFASAMAVMGLVHSWWALLLAPTGVLVSFAFGGVGFVTASLLRSWLDFEYVTMATVPMFLFSASFFPLSRYPGPVAFVVQLTPLYHGVDLARDLTVGAVGPASLASVLYLAAMGTVGMVIANRRVRVRLQP